MNNYKPMWAEKPEKNKIQLNEYELKELSIIKQAILKSAIEGGVITKDLNESDEEFIERWIKYVRRNEEQDLKMFFEQELPF